MTPQVWVVIDPSNTSTMLVFGERPTLARLIEAFDLTPDVFSPQDYKTFFNVRNKDNVIVLQAFHHGVI